MELQTPSRIVFCLFTLLLLASSLSYAASKEPLLISYRLDSAPIQFQNDDGEPEGILIDYWKLWSSKSGISINFKGAYNQQAQNMLLAGDADFSAGLFANDKRRKTMSFSDIILSSPYHLYVHDALGENFKLDTANKLKQFRVGVTQGSFHENFMQMEYPDVELVRFDGYEALFNAANEDRVEAFIAQPMYLAFHRQHHPGRDHYIQTEPPLYTQGYRAAVSHQNAALLGVINQSIRQISNAEKAAIASKWLGIRWNNANNKPLPKLALTKKEKQWLADHNAIRIGVDPDWPPIEYIDRKKRYSGIASDYVSLIEDKLAVSFIYDADRSWAAAIEQIKAGKIDVLPAVSRTREREAYLNFTRPYLKFPYVIFTRNDAPLLTGLDELIGKQVVVEKEYANHNLLKDNHPAINLVLVATTEEALRAVSLGQADAYMGNLAAASHILLESGIANLKVAAPTPYSNDLCFAVRKDYPELVSIIQKSLDTVSVKQANDFKRKWFSVRFEHDFDYGLLWKVIGLGLLILSLAALWIWMVIRQKEALRISEERFRLVMNAAQEGIWDWNLLTNKIYFNPGIYKILGFEAGAIPKDFSGLSQLLPEEHREQTIRHFRDILAGCKTPYSYEFSMYNSKGNPLCLLARGTLEINRQGKPVRSLGSISDITEKKAAQQRLAQSEQQLKTIIDAIPLAIIIVEDDGTIVYANKETEKDASPGQSAIGLNMLSYYENPEDRDRLYEIYQKKGRVDAMPMRYRTPSGKIIEGIISMLPVYFNDGIKNLGVLVDLTDRINMERELLAAKIQAEAANKTKSSFLANMSHEIRTPMNAILGLGHLISKTNLNARQQDYVDKINTSAHSLLGIINDILDFSKIEAGKLEIEKTEFSLEDVMANLSSMIAIRAEEKGLEIAYSIDPDVPQRLKGDPLRLGQILINLTQNAIKFSASGVVMVNVTIIENSTRQIRLGFSVQDSGIGIDDEQIDTLFEAFSQADDSHTRRYGGTGLGLAICKQLVELMDGQISVTSKLGQGSTFSFQLPFDIADETRKTSKHPVDFTGKRALIIDDNSTARQILGSMLSSFHFEVDTAESGREGFEKVRKMNGGNASSPYDLVLVDWKMPEMNGIQTVQHIRQTVSADHSPVIIMVTSYGREEIMHQAEQTGLDSFLIKPINSSILYNSILECMYDSANKQKTITPPVVEREKLSGTVLLVEDNSINQQVAEEILQNLGLDVAVASDGHEAMEVLNKQTFDLILTDIQMPNMDGYELTMAIRSDPVLANTPVIAMTAHAMEGDRERCLAAGMDDHIPKPIDPGKLHSSLKTWLSRPSRKAELMQATDHNVNDLPEYIAGIDIQWGLQQIGGNRKLFTKLLREFAEDYSNADEELKSAISGGDLDNARPMLHTIQGIAGNIGARRLHDTALSVSQCLKTEAKEDLQQLAQIFYQAFDEIKLSLKAWIDNSDKDVSKDKVGKYINLNSSLLKTLESLIEQGNPEAGRLLANIDRSQLDTSVIELINLALDSVNNYDFTNAQDVISRLESQV